MIRVIRESVEVPSIFKSGLVDKAFQDAREFYKIPLNSRLQKRHNFNSKIWRDSKVRAALDKLFNGKCSYCESKVGLTDAGDVDQFRPKAGAFNLVGSFDPDHYWWLTYDWRNLYLACRICNTNKASKFPVGKKRVEVPKGDRAQYGAPWLWDELKMEGALLLDPCDDDPAAHLLFDLATGSVGGISERGEITIQTLKLNREALIKERFAAIRDAEKQLADFLASRKQVSDAKLKQKLSELESPALTYAGARRQALHALLSESFKKLQKLPSPPGGLPSKQRKKRKQLTVDWLPAPAVSDAQARAVVKKSLIEQKKLEEVRTEKAKFEIQYVTRIEIHNFKAIEHIMLDFPEPREDRASWAVLLGENGVGKSSVLKAMVLALMDKERLPRLGLRASNFVRYGQQSGYVKVHVTGYTEPFQLGFKRGQKQFTKANHNKLQTMLLGYGGTRLLPRKDHAPARTDGVARIENLFDPFLPLVDAESWLVSLDTKPFGYCARAIKDLLAREAGDRLIRLNKKVKLKVMSSQGSIPLEELSDGYQSMVALATDMMNFMMKTWHVAEKAQGIVLIDEIDMHLHPRWKMSIVNSLRRTFPHVQFIVTTHDPLCLRGTRRGEVYVLNRATPESPIAAVRTDVPSGATPDQLLTGFWFGLSSTVDEQTLELLDEHRKLLRSRRTAANARRRRYLERALKRRLGVFADTSVDRMAESVAAELLEDEDYGSLGPQQRRKVRSEIRREVVRKTARRG